MAPQDERDPLNDLFSGVVLPPHDPARREAIFAQTRPVLRRRRIVRRCAWGAALAACYAVGALSVLAWQSDRPRDQLAGPPDGKIEIQNARPTDEPTLPRPEPGPSSDEGGNMIARSEPAASLSTFEKLRRAGDRQLNERGNLQGAIGCYRRALDFASDDELQIVPQRDSWLLIPLKEARLETRKHAHEKS
jgi:hypothetical protein